MKPFKIKPRKVFIYALLDPITNKPRYIGQTTNPTKRAGSHIRSIGPSVPALRQWVESLKSEGKRPGFVVLAQTTIDKGGSVETREIKRARKEGNDLFNQRLGSRLNPATYSAIKCLETGQIFDGWSEAERAIGYSRTSIKKAISSGEGLGWIGYHYEQL